MSKYFLVIYGYSVNEKESVRGYKLQKGRSQREAQSHVRRKIYKELGQPVSITFYQVWDLEYSKKYEQVDLVALLIDALIYEDYGSLDFYLLEADYDQREYAEKAWAEMTESRNKLIELVGQEFYDVLIAEELHYIYS